MEDRLKYIGLIIKIIVFLVCVYVIMTFHSKTGLLGIGMQLLGLGGLLVLLYLYNKPYSN